MSQPMFGLSFQEILKAVRLKKIVNPYNLPLEIRGISLDTRVLKKKEGFLALKGKNFDAHSFLEEAQNKGANFLIAERIPKILREKIRLSTLIVEDTLLALGLLGKALREKFSPLVCGIIGSQGKTTTKDMTAFILSKYFSLLKNKSSENNQIGVPKTLLSLNKNHKVCILELGTNHFGEIAYLSSLSQPDVVVLTCIDDVHLEFFKDKRGVFREKASVFKTVPLAFPILNGDDPYLIRLKTKRKPFYFGKSHKFTVYFDFKKRERNNLLFRINSRHLLKLNTFGFFNIYNALASLACALYLGKPLKESVEILSNFKFPKMRLQLQNIKGIKFINDAYNSNPTALKKALESLAHIRAKRRIAVLADMLELGEKSLYFHRKVAESIYKANFDYLIFLGRFTKVIASSLIKRGFSKDSIFLAKEISSAKKQLFKIAKKGDLVFLKGSRKFGLEILLS